MASEPGAKQAGDLSVPAVDDAGSDRAPYIEVPFPVRLRTTAPDGERHLTEALVDRLSARGLQVRLSERLSAGDRLPVLVHLSVAPDTVAGLRLVALALVTQVEELPDGSYRTTARFDRQWLLSRGWWQEE